MEACERRHMQFLDDEFGRRTVNRWTYLPEPSHPGRELEALRKARDAARDELWVKPKKQPVPPSESTKGSSRQDVPQKNGEPDPRYWLDDLVNILRNVPVAIPSDSKQTEPRPAPDEVDESVEEVFDVYTTTEWPIVGHGEPFERRGKLVVEVNWKPLLIRESVLEFDIEHNRHFVELEQGRKFWCESQTQDHIESVRGVVKVSWVPTVEPWSNLGQPDDAVASIEHDEDVVFASDDDSEVESDEDEIVELRSRRRAATSCWAATSCLVQGTRDAQQYMNRRRPIAFRRNSLDDVLTVVPTDADRDYNLAELIKSTRERLNHEVLQRSRTHRQKSHRHLSIVLALPQVRRVMFSPYAASGSIRWNGRRQNKALATAVQAVGMSRAACDRCRKTGKGGPTFQGCVTLSIDGRPILNGSCACCYYQGDSECQYRIVPGVIESTQEERAGARQIDHSGVCKTGPSSPRSVSEGIAAGSLGQASTTRPTESSLRPARRFESEPAAHASCAGTKRTLEGSVNVREHVARRQCLSARKRMDLDQEPVQNGNRHSATGLASPPRSSPPITEVTANERGRVQPGTNTDPSGPMDIPIKLEQQQQFATPPSTQQLAVDLGVFDFGPGKKAIVFRHDAPEHLSEKQARWLFNQCTCEDEDVLVDLKANYLTFEAAKTAQGLPSSPYAYLQESEFAHRKLNTLIRLYGPKRQDIVELDLDSNVLAVVKLDNGDED